MTRSTVVALLLGIALGAGGTFAILRVLRPEPAGKPAAPPPAAARPDGPPAAAAARENATLRARLRFLDNELRGLAGRLRKRAAAAKALAGEAAATTSLRKEVERLRDQLRTEKLVRRALEGKPYPFPADLPDRFKQPSLLRTFAEALKRAGIEGEVQSIDCNEFPCIVYGRFESKNREGAGKTLRSLLGEVRKEHRDDHLTTSLWTTMEKQGEGKARGSMFGIAVFPNDPALKKDADFRRRLRYRQSTYVDATTNP